jgi:hypothetical protein
MMFLALGAKCGALNAVPESGVAARSDGLSKVLSAKAPMPVPQSWRKRRRVEALRDSKMGVGNCGCMERICVPNPSRSSPAHRTAFGVL